MNYSNLSIKQWAVEDRPREKLMRRGLSALTDAELLALILGTGVATPEAKLSALDLARGLLQDHGGLGALARCGVPELTRATGIGQAKAIAIVATFELGRRKSSNEARNFRASDAASVAGYLQAHIGDLRQEVFFVLFLNRNNEVIAEEQVFKGGVSATIIDPKIIFKAAVNHLAAAIILAHNHPSGSLRPSRADLDVTSKLRAGSELFDIHLIDHLIVSDRGYYSFAENGWE